MKIYLSVLFLMTSLNLFSAEKIFCSAKKAMQSGMNDMLAEADLNFEITKAGNESRIENVVGHIFVKSPFEENTDSVFSTKDSYMGFFKIESLKANIDYRPKKYKGYAQFLKFDAVHTAGLESGMWGYLAVDVSKKEKSFDGVYVFQAGDHMGATVLLSCEVH
jgi:hypothetical protein